MNVRSSFLALALLACAPAYGAADTRIRVQAYDPNQIVRIIGKAGIQSTIEFGDDERIENVAVGDSAAWQITPNHRASLLFVKPLTAHSRTNMTVVTDRRTYMFDLVAGDKSSAPLYAMKFSYPNEKPVEVAKATTQVAVVTPPAPTPAMVAAKLHFDWNTKGNGKLLPTRVFDDGSALFLAWSHDTPLPAILTMSEDRKEGPLNYRMDGDYIVIAPIPQNVVLRYGNKTAALWPSRRIAPAQSSAVAATSVAPPQASPVQQAPAPVAAPPPSAVRVANLTALYSDKLTDTAHDQ
ncbi:MAG TPA: TrbG/VirB9 family P-type conjugative transfer protein [Sphingomicrobium sp.]